MPKHLTMTRREGEDREEFIDRVSAQVAEHFSEDAPEPAAVAEPPEDPATDVPAEEPDVTESAPPE